MSFNGVLFDTKPRLEIEGFFGQHKATVDVKIYIHLHVIDFVFCD